MEAPSHPALVVPGGAAWSWSELSAAGVAAERELEAEGDPRMFGKGDEFDQYPYADEKHRDFYNRLMKGEKLTAGWVNPTDFEKVKLD